MDSAICLPAATAVAGMVSTLHLRAGAVLYLNHLVSPHLEKVRASVSFPEGPELARVEQRWDRVFCRVDVDRTRGYVDIQVQQKPQDVSA